MKTKQHLGIVLLLAVLLTACGSDVTTTGSTDVAQDTERDASRIVAELAEYKETCRARYSDGYRGYNEATFESFWTEIEKATMLEWESCLLDVRPSPLPCETVALNYLSFRSGLECY